MATIYGNDSANTINGTAYSDTIYTKGGNDKAYGLGGNDNIIDWSGSDTLYGGAGNDTLDGGWNDRTTDYLYGESGNDRLDGGRGDQTRDYLYGGGDSDNFVFSARLVGGANEPGHYVVGWGSDIVKDFKYGQDRLDFTGVHDVWDEDYVYAAECLRVSQSGGNTIVKIYANAGVPDHGYVGEAILEGVSLTFEQLRPYIES